MADSSSYPEVLSVKIETGLFAEGITELIKQWETFAQKVGSENVGVVLGTNLSKGIIEGLSSIQETLNAVSSSVIASMDVMVSKVEETNDKLSSIKTGGSRGGTSSGGLFGDLGGDLGKIAKIAIEWQIIGKVLEGLGSLVSAPFRALAEGEEYFKKTQQDATNLEAALLSSVRFSKDLGQNLKDTQIGSVAVAKALQDIVISSPGLKLQDVQSSFKIISESIGGEGGVDTLQKMLDLTQQFSVAIRSSGVDVQVTRRLASELPKLFSGTLTENSPLARILGKSNVELKQMVEDGKKFNDLQERLAPLLASVVAQLKDSKETLESTEERADLVGKRLEGIYATEGLKSYQAELQVLIDKMNDPVWEKHAGNLGGFLAWWGKIKADFSSVPAFVTAIATAGEDPDYARKLGLNPNTSRPYRTTSEAGSDISLQDVFKRGKAEGILDQHIDSTGNKVDLTKKKAAPFDVSDISTHIAEYRENLQKLTAEFEHAKQAEDELVSSGQESKTKESFNIKVAAAGSAAKATVEYSRALQQLIKDHGREISNIHSVASENAAKGKETDQDTINKDIHEANKRFETAKTELSKNLLSTTESFLSQEVAAEKAANQEIQAIRKANFEASMEMAKKEAEYNIAIAEHKASTVSLMFGAGLETQQSVLDSKRQSIEERRKALDLDNDQIESAYLQQISTTATGSTDRVSATNKYNSANADLSLKYLSIGQELKALDIETYSIEQQMNNSRVEFLQKIIALSIEYRQAQETQRYTGQQITDSSMGRDTDSKQHYSVLESIRTDEVSAAKALIQYNQVLITTIEDSNQRLKIVKEIAQLESQITNLNRGRVTDANAKLSEIDADGGSQAVRNIRKRASLNKDVESAKGAGDYSSAVALNTELSNLQPSISQLKDNIEAMVPGLKADIDVLTSHASAMDKTTAAVSAFTSVIGAVQQGIGVYQQGKQQGGTMGGVGSLMSQYGGMIPVAGPFIQAAGAVLSVIGGIFTKEAEHIVSNINNQFNFTMQQLSNGQAGINTTLQAVMAERTAAIQQLSGIKGGQDQLKNILPGLNQEIAQLQAQQQQASRDWGNTYNELAMQLDAGSQVGSQIMQNWVSINQQVYNYVNATGDATTATKFLSMTLQQLQITSQQSLNQGEQQAIQDAISLNSQLLQRMQLIESLNQQAFALQNADSTERTQAGSVTRAQQLQSLQRQSQQQLLDLNFQIDQTQQVVNAESSVFTIASNIYDLHTRDNALTLSTLQLQLNGYKQLQDIIASITQGSNGLFSSTQAWLNPITNPVTTGQTLTFSPGSIVVNITDTTGTASQVTGDTVYAAIQQSARNGGQTA
jgi:hypothetical protein